MNCRSCGKECTDDPNKYRDSIYYGAKDSCANCFNRCFLPTGSIPNISVAIITPTMGRTTFYRAAKSVLPQLKPGDEWWVVGDGSQPMIRAFLEYLAHPCIRYFPWKDPASIAGNAQRNEAMKRASSNFFMFLDDDDWLMPDGLDSIRRHGVDMRPMMLDVVHWLHRKIYWHSWELKLDNVAGSQFVIPNIPGKFAFWEVGRPVADQVIIRETLALCYRS